MGRESIVRSGPSQIVGATLAVVLLAGCGGADPAGEEPAGTPSQTTESAASSYTFEQAESALRAVESVSTTPQYNTEPSPGSDTFMEQLYQRRMTEAELEPIECAQQYRDLMQLELDTMRTPRASVAADDNRLIVGVTVHPDARAAQDAGRLIAQRDDEPCLEYTVTAPADPRREDLDHTRVTTTPFSVDLPEAAEHVAAATVESHAFDIPAPHTVRNSRVSAVVGNVQVNAGYGHPDDPEVPVLAERAAAERAARQVITELIGSR